MDDLAGLSVEDLMGNKAALTMLMHYHSAMVSENGSLKNDLNTARTYVEGFNRKKTNAVVGAVSLLVSNLLIGFGVNFLSGDEQRVFPAGYVLIGLGVVVALVGMYFTLKD